MRILRGVGSGSLPCGCFVGLYETYSGPTVQVIEERGVSCADSRHKPGAQMPVDRVNHPVTSAPTPVAKSAA